VFRVRFCEVVVSKGKMLFNLETMFDGCHCPEDEASSFVAVTDVAG
jgi:hypothetical protein